jgi:hypothetical protein
VPVDRVTTGMKEELRPFVDEFGTALGELATAA